MIVAVVVGVLSLAVLVFAFLASKVWHWAHVLTLVLFYFASVGYAVLAARSLDVRRDFQKQEATALTQIEEQQTLNDALERGAPEASSQVINRLSRDVAVAKIASEQGSKMPGVTQLGHELRMQNRVRGRVWRGVRPNGVDAQTNAVAAVFDPPQRRSPEDGGPPAEEEAPVAAPLSLEPDAILYVFEQGPAGEIGEDGPERQYIGEFRVDQVKDREVLLEPLDQLELDSFAQQRLVESRGPWIVYETMPADDRNLFAEMDEETRRRLLPAGSVEEYLRDKTPITPDDPLDRHELLDSDGNVLPPDTPESEVASTRYRRRLRDYTLLLNDFERERAALVAREQALSADIEKLKQALEGAERVRSYRDVELGKWQADLDAVVRDRAALERHVAILERQTANARRLLEATLEENARLASARANQRGVLAPIGSGALDMDAL